MTIKVLIVEDSSVMRLVLREIVDGAPDLRVAGTAADSVEALALIGALNPDVLTLDVEMPKMNGLDFLRQTGLSFFAIDRFGESHWTTGSAA